MRKRFLSILFLISSLASSAALHAFTPQSLNPTVAINSSGQRAMAWTNYATVNSQIQAAVFSGGVWSATDTLSIASERNGSASIAIDNAGNVAAVWIAATTTPRKVQVKSAIFSGGSWSPPATVSTQRNFVTNLRFSMNASGEAIAVWISEAGVEAAVYQSNTWAAPTTLSSSGTHPDVANSSTGLVVWEDDQDIQSAIWNGSGWSSAASISQNGTQNTFPTVSINSSGEGVAAWWQIDGSTARISGNYFTGGAWQTSANFSPDGEGVSSLSLSMNEANEAVAIWTGTVVGKASVTKAMTYNGSSWTLPQQISSSALHSSLYAHVATGGPGEAIATWTQLGPNTERCVIGATFSGGSWGTPSLISPTGEFSTNNAVAMNPSNESLIAWSNLTQKTVQETTSKP